MRWIAAVVVALSLVEGSAESRPKNEKQSAKGYAHAVDNWHTKTPDPAPRDKNGRPLLVLNLLNRNEKCNLAATSDRGDFTTAELERASRCLRDAAGGTFPIEPRFLSIVYEIERAFDAGEIRVISGYRGVGPRFRKSGKRIVVRRSNHSLGRAIDFIVPGATNDSVAEMLRSRGYVGVGIYPSSGFIHLDVRSKSYFWVDRSGPGKRNHERGILGDLARESDRKAKENGEAPVDAILTPGIDAFLKSRGIASPDLEDDDEEDEMGSELTSGEP